jgi:hypothetical protein
MTTKKFAQGLIVTVALCLSATVGRDQNSLVYVTGGGTSIRDARSFYEAGILYSTLYATGGAANLGIEVPLKKSKIFGFEASYGFSQSNLRLTNQNTNPVTVKSYGLRDSRFSGDLVVHSPSTYRGARPYFVLGAEYDRYSPTSAATSLATTTGFGSAAVAKLTSEGSGGVNFGGGIDYEIGKKVSLRLDVRDHVTGSPTFGLPTSQPSTAGLAWFPATGSAHNIEYTIGIAYHFGRNRASTPSSRAPSSQAPSSSSGETRASASLR